LAQENLGMVHHGKQPRATSYSLDEQSFHPGILVSTESFILSTANSIGLALIVNEMIHIITIPNKFHF
jgi:hypothetical protein